MKIRVLLFSGVVLAVPSFSYAACSVANLTRCLDSVCAINIGANPAARCQYCGTSSAGNPDKSTTMKTISAGTSSKYTISDKELKTAPADAGERYVWGTKLCLEKLPECSTEDVSENYDSLIEQSCTAAGISAEMANLASKSNKTKNQNSCNQEMEVCIVDSARCTADYRNCKSESDFDKYFSECSIASQGCDSFLSDIRDNLTSARDKAIANADKILKNIVMYYQNAREQRLQSTQTACKNNKAKQECVERVCKNNMRNKCKENKENNIANELCKFYDIACERLK